MKKKKLSLDALKVKSFVTSFDGKNENTVRGGDPGGNHDTNVAAGCEPEEYYVFTTPLYSC